MKDTIFISMNAKDFEETFLEENEILYNASINDDKSYLVTLVNTPIMTATKVIESYILLDFFKKDMLSESEFLSNEVYIYHASFDIYSQIVSFTLKLK